MQDHRAFVYGDIGVVFLQFGTRYRDFYDSKHCYPCANKCYHQIKNYCDFLPRALCPLIVLIK